MPLVRIDLLAGKPDAYRRAVGNVVYEALIGIGVPDDDRFQVVNEREPGNFFFSESYLDIHRSADVVFVQITLNEGRTIDAKRSLYLAIAEGLRDVVGLRMEDVFISLVEVKKENWSFGNGLAQYAV